ncbi:MAG: hypothetical protein Q7R82_01890 [Candidatus Daviesbacteria bacterium]|nr:hypothetical protein [Candidatus Daviesbacteria bacterium]
MTERAVIVHQSVVQEWAGRDNPPAPLTTILNVLIRINEVKSILPAQDVIVVEESPTTGFLFLPGKVGVGNSARLFGARAGYCLRIARSVLEEVGIKVTLDQAGALP